jgi:hypothetical protein
MTPEAAEEFTASLGQIGAGFWRQIHWADEQGVPQALGVSLRDWVEERVGGYVRLGSEDRTEAILELHDMGLGIRKIAEILGLGYGTVQQVLADRNRSPELADTGKDQDDSDDTDRNGSPELKEDNDGDLYDSHDDEVSTKIESAAAEDPELKAATFFKNFTRDMKSLGKLLSYQPDRVAEVAALKPELRETLESIVPEWKRWIDATDKALNATKRVRRVK